MDNFIKLFSDFRLSPDMITTFQIAKEMSCKYCYTIYVLYGFRNLQAPTKNNMYTYLRYSLLNIKFKKQMKR